MSRLAFTKFGLINALLSLIPIFPAWTLFPGIIAGKGLGDLLENCERGYLIVLWVSFTLSVFLILKYLREVKAKIDSNTEKQLRLNFRLFSLGIYTLLNTGIIIIILGTNLACHGDGQTILAFIYSGPMASIGLIALGFIVDLKRDS